MNLGGGQLYPWWESLTSVPHNKNYGFIGATKFMPIVGFLNDCTSLTSDLTSTKNVNVDFERYLSEKKISWDRDAYQLVSPTYPAVNKATLKYDHEWPDEPPSTLMEVVFQDLCQIYEPLIGKCEIREYGDILVNPKSSSGFVGKMAGCSKKIDFIKKDSGYIKTFLERAHLENYPVLWTQSGKVELLKASKIANNDIRVFTVVPFEMFVYMAQLFQDQNEKMCEPSFFMTTPLRHGYNMTHSGFIDLVDEMNIRGWKKGEGDAVKWDSSVPWSVRQMAMRLRQKLWNGKGMPREEFFARTYYAYFQAINSYLKTPSGQVLMKLFGGVNSGDPTTTDDNCICHMVIWCILSRIRYGMPFYELYPTYIRLCIYADDHIFSVDPSIELHPFEIRASIYKRLGVTLDAAKDLVSDTFEGHTFLGLTAKWDARYQCYVPHFNEAKALCTLYRNKSGLDVQQYYCKLLAIMLLTAFSPLFPIIQEYAYRYYSKFRVILKDLPVLRASTCTNFWLCKEASLPNKVMGEVLKICEFTHAIEEDIEETTPKWKNHQRSLRTTPRNSQTKTSSNQQSKTTDRENSSGHGSRRS